jgi:hypothetical protein
MTEGRRSRGRLLVVLTVVVLAIGGAYAAASSGRLPFLRRTWGTVASAVSSAVASAAAPLASAVADSPAVADAGSDAATMPHRQTAPLSSAQLGAPLRHGTFVTECGAPDTMKVVVKADVRLGRAVNVSVKTEPPSLNVASCIEQRARDLQWDVSPKMGHVTVRY